MAIAAGELVLEIGNDDDVDADLRTAIEKKCGNSLLSDDSQEVVDAVLMWWREEDGDLVDELVDALTFLTETGPIWLMTPKVGRPGHVPPSDIQDAAPTAGLTQTSSFLATSEWTATRLVPRQIGKSKSHSHGEKGK